MMALPPGSSCGCWGLNPAIMTPLPSGEGEPGYGVKKSAARPCADALSSPVSLWGCSASPSPNFLKYKTGVMILAFQDPCEVTHVKRLKSHSWLFIPECRLWSPKDSALNPDSDLAHVSSWASDLSTTSQHPLL